MDFNFKDYKWNDQFTGVGQHCVGVRDFGTVGWAITNIDISINIISIMIIVDIDINFDNRILYY